MKDEALTPVKMLMENLPIAPPTDEIRAEIEPIVSRLIEITKANQEADRDVLDWLLVEQGIEKPGQKVEDFTSLDTDSFVQEVKKRKPKSVRGLMPAVLKTVRQVYSNYALEIRPLARIPFCYRILTIGICAIALPRITKLSRRK